MKQPAENPLIVALDLSDAGQALALVRALKGRVAFFKVGLQLFSAAGPSIVQRICEEGGRVFLDLKLHDIPNTVGQAAVEGARLGAELMTVHALGGRAMMEEARRRMADGGTAAGRPRPKLLAVTILTSLDELSLREVALEASLPRLVVQLARQARLAGMDGIVASARDLRFLREGGVEDLLRVTPGIRPAGSGTDDQRRTLTATEALAEGADYLVVGRPILQASSPLQAVEALLTEIGRARMNP